MDFSIRPLTADLWDDLEQLFGPERGAHAGCWCMWWRLTSAEFENASRSERKANFRALVEAGGTSGILAYDGDRPVAWCAVGPRDSLPKLMRSRVARPLDGDPATTWMINCFFIDRAFRGRGLTRLLIDAAADFADKNGATAVEACPLDTERKLIWGEGFVGLARTFRAAGFEEITRRAPNRPLMRRPL